MSFQPTQRLTRLLTAFDAERLGEGNIAAGANVLTAMACTIANVHRRGACLTGADGSSFHVGASLLASGPLSASLIGERVVDVLAGIQTNFLNHLQEWSHAKQFIIQNANTGPPNLRQFTIKADTSAVAILNDEAPLRDYCINRLLTPFPNQPKRALLSQPLVYVTGASLAAIRRNLERSHLGRPLLFDVLHSPSHCADLAECCLPVIDGSLVSDALSTPVHGHVLLSDPSRVLDEMVRTNSEAARWLLRLPWLVDGNTGPEVSPGGDAAATLPRLDRMEQRYELALRKAWQMRLDHRVAVPLTQAIGLTTYQSQWIGYLGGCESSFPGIISAARPLLASLVFGLFEMATSMEQPAGFRFDSGDVVALAGFLVQRMVNSHTMLTKSGEQELRQRYQLRILDRLTEGPMSARDLGRRFHRMTTNQCRNLLDDLRGTGRVVELSGDRWQLAASVMHSDTRNLVLNV